MSEIIHGSKIHSMVLGGGPGSSPDPSGLTWDANTSSNRNVKYDAVPTMNFINGRLVRDSRTIRHELAFTWSRLVCVSLNWPICRSKFLGKEYERGIKLAKSNQWDQSILLLIPNAYDASHRLHHTLKQVLLLHKDSSGCKDDQNRNRLAMALWRWKNKILP